MNQQPYNDKIRKEMILRDHLAAARTVLANERTILAYLRTALTTIAAGVGLIELTTTPAMQTIGWILLPVGAACLVIGVVRYLQFRQYISQLTRAEKDLETD
ncbi:MAG: DUF202 domain-containing protein [Candidatus Hydrogenedentes bacterium]|nr:DUF202 domain-containing protein [Candidatus Hydrogenedentota bacterium]